MIACSMGSKWPSRPSLEKEIKSTRNLKFSQALATRCKKNDLTPKKKKESSFLFETCFHYFYTWSFQVPLEKKLRLPSYSTNLHQKLQFNLCPSYITWKNHSTPSPPSLSITKGGGVGVGVADYKLYRTSHPIYNTLISYKKATFNTLLRIWLTLEMHFEDTSN